MKAAIYARLGPSYAVQITEVEKPVPKDDEVLIRVRAASVNPLDRLPFAVARIARMTAGLLKPKPARLGVDAAGEVEAVGGNVTQFKPGDDVFGSGRGAFAEYLCATEVRLALKPANLSFEDAAAVPVAATTALQGLRDHGGIQRGQKVLVDGASGGVGTFSNQIAKSFGAEVTAVCSTRNVDTARTLGADRVVDYTREDFTRGAERYDLILAANAHHSLFDYRRALSRNGVFVFIGGGWSEMLQAMGLSPLLSRIGSKRMRWFVARLKHTDLVFLGNLLETGKVASLIDRRYPLGDVAEALRYLAAGHAQGKVVINVAQGDETHPR